MIGGSALRRLVVLSFVAVAIGVMGLRGMAFSNSKLKTVYEDRTVGLVQLSARDAPGMAVVSRGPASLAPASCCLGRSKHMTWHPYVVGVPVPSVTWAI